MLKYKKEFIEFLARCGALTTGDFTTKSGRKTPYFINIGNIKSGKDMIVLANAYVDAISHNFSLAYLKTVDFLFGPAYKGIPLVTMVAIKLYEKYGINLEICYNRKEAKNHGEKGSIVGCELKNGMNGFIIEDITTAGTSLYETIPLIKDIADVDVAGLIVAVNRMEKGTEKELGAFAQLKRDFGLNPCAIVNVEEVMEHLYKKEMDGKVYIDEKNKPEFEAYLKKHGA